MKKIYSPLVLVALFLVALPSAKAKEGMWLPYLLESLNAQEMKDMGLEIPISAIYSVNEASLKDAIVSFGGFCTGEVISKNGLVLTNHHCGYGQIQSHSSVENDLLKEGFWAMDASEELTNPGLFVTFIKYMEDVTNDLMLHTTPGMDEATMDSIVNHNRKSILAAKKVENPDFEFIIKDFFYGNQFILFATQKYTDVRLVGAPPSSIGKFGADTDNWMWPRHTGDFSLFRIYADSSNAPSDISASNVPFTPAQFLKINMDGAADTDFTMIFGFPGRTEEYLPASGVEQTVALRNPIRISIRDKRLALLDARMRTSDEVRIKYASKYASIANGWKKWQGQNIGIEEVHALDSIRADEARIMEAIENNKDLYGRYGRTLARLDSLYQEMEPFAVDYEYFVEVAYRGLEITRYANTYQTLINAVDDKDLRDQDKSKYKVTIRNAAMKLLESADGFYKNYDEDVDREAMGVLLRLYAESIPMDRLPEILADLKEKQIKYNEKEEGQDAFVDFVNEAFAQGWLTQETKRQELKRLLAEDPSKLAEKLEDDDIVVLTTELFGHYTLNTRPGYSRNYLAIQEEMKNWMKVQMEVSQKVLYPDANSTLRLTYGKVEGYSPNDSTQYNTRTYLGGVVNKYVPGDYEFDLPQKIIDLHKNKDFGPYADATGDVPVCFIASNHTSGGNSGSPALNGKGELIGLNFDRVWEGTMSDLYFDDSRCRNIMVDARYVLFIIDKYAGAGYLLEEMELVSYAGGDSPTDTPESEDSKL